MSGADLKKAVDRVFRSRTLEQLKYEEELFRNLQIVGDYAVTYSESTGQQEKSLGSEPSRIWELADVKAIFVLWPIDPLNTAIYIKDFTAGESLKTIVSDTTPLGEFLHSRVSQNVKDASRSILERVTPQ